MGLANLERGQRIKLDGVCFELTGLLPSGKWQLMDIDTGLRDEQTPDDLWQAFLQRRLRFVDGLDDTENSPSILTTLSNAAEATSHDCKGKGLNDALRRHQYVQEIEKLRGLSPLKETIYKTWEKLQWPEKAPVLRTAQNWCAKARVASDPVNALIEKTHHKGNRSARYSSELVEMADELIQKKYLKNTPRLTLAKTAEELARLVRKENTRRPASEHLPIPKRKFIKSRIAVIPEYELIAARFGVDAARVAMRTSLGGVETSKALQIGELDHTLQASILLDDDFMPWGRSSASVCIDAHTRAPTGLSLGAEVPSIVSVARCIESSVLPKTELLKKYPTVKGRWDCYGIHETYVVDNGLEEHATALRQAASELGGSTIEFCPRKAPWFKPHVERFFRTQDLDLLQTLPGCTGENINVRPAFNPKKDLLIRRQTFEIVFMKWLVDIYLRRPQKCLGDISPAEAWKRSVTLEEQLVPTRRIALERLFLRKETGKSLDHEGITFDCLIYNSRDLGALRSQLGAKLCVDIWVSDEDLGYIYVVVPNQDVVIRVPCLDQLYTSGLTRWQHEKCKKLRRIRMDEGLQLSLDEAREEIGKLIEADLAELRHARRKKRTRFIERKATNSSGNTATAASTVSANTDAVVSRADQDFMRSENDLLPDLPRVSINRSIDDAKQ